VATPAAPPVLRACAVRVPCSTSNLGAGFDCLGLALDRYLDAGFEPREGGLVVERSGTLAELDVADGEDILAAAFAAELKRRGAGDAGGALVATSAIPVGRGLGSSAAAAVAGIALATAATGSTFDRAAILASAVVMEGHPDNAAPAVFGGLVAVAFTEHSTPRAMRLGLDGGIAFVYAAPSATISTRRARAALPQQVPHSAATRNLGRLAALLWGLANGDRAAVAAGFNDELHVPYRLPLIPGGADVIRAAVDAGAWAATISGSGSGIIAACARDTERKVLEAMEAVFARHGGGTAFVAHPDPHGVQPRDLVTLQRSLRD
jgi:homoserine kinase